MLGKRGVTTHMGLPHAPLVHGHPPLVHDALLSMPHAPPVPLYATLVYNYMHKFPAI